MFYLRYLYQTRFTYQMMFVPSNSNRRVSNVAPVLLTIAGHPSSPPVFLWGLCCSIFKFLCSVLMVIICSSVCSFGRCAVSLSSSHGFWLPPFSIFWLPPLSIFWLPPFSILWLPLQYLLVAPLVYSGYSLQYVLVTPFSIFWLPPLVSSGYPPLVSSGYPFSNFWLPLQYLLVTPFSIFWLPPLVSSGYPLQYLQIFLIDLYQVMQ